MKRFRQLIYEAKNSKDEKVPRTKSNDSKALKIACIFIHSFVLLRCTCSFKRYTTDIVFHLGNQTDIEEFIFHLCRMCICIKLVPLLNVLPIYLKHRWFTFFLTECTCLDFNHFIERNNYSFKLKKGYINCILSRRYILAPKNLVKTIADLLSSLWKVSDLSKVAKSSRFSPFLDWSNLKEEMVGVSYMWLPSELKFDKTK